MINRGVVYCITNDHAYLEAALISALALRHLEPELPITILSTHTLLKQLVLIHEQISVRFITPQELPQGNAFVSRYLKTDLVHWSPYAETLFLDADILPRRSLGQLWSYLQDADFAMAADRLPTVAMCDHIASAEKTYTLNLVPADATQFNSGVMLWRHNPATQQLFEQWHQEWQVFQKQDQLALVRALHRTQVKVAQLPRSYNISPIDAQALPPPAQPVHLLHCWGGMVPSGEFRRIAQTYYPDVVAQVDRLLGTTPLTQSASGSNWVSL